MATFDEVLEQSCADGSEYISLEMKNAQDKSVGTLNSKMNSKVSSYRNNIFVKKRKKDEVVNRGFENKKKGFDICKAKEIPVCPLQLFKISIPKISTEVMVSESSLKSPIPAHSQKSVNIICKNFSKDKSLKLRCESVLNLAVLCVCDNTIDILPSECIAVLPHLSDSHKYASLAVCHALLLCSVTQLSLTLEDIKSIEECILKLLCAVLATDGDMSQSSFDNDYEMNLLSKEHESSIHRLCCELFHGAHFDVNNIKMSSICCLSFFNLSSLLEKYSSSVSVNYTYKDNTLKYILGCMGKSTQEIVSENLSGVSLDSEFVNLTHLTVQQCLKVIECALTLNTRVHHSFLQHKIFSLPHCLTRLLSWCVSLLFPLEKVEKSENNSSFIFHRSTLLSILKVLSVLSFNPNQYDDFTNVKGLMEKIMICGLKAYFELQTDSFDVLILCLELLINLHIKNRKAFCLLCLKKFPISKFETVLCVEALIQILLNSLEKIKEIKILKNKLEKSSGKASSNKDSEPKEEEKDLKIVLQAADKDMEHSTIASFVSVLLVFFANTKQSFLELVKEKLSVEVLAESLDVTRKFLQFAILTRGMPESGILILKHTISKLQKISSSYEVTMNK